MELTVKVMGELTKIVGTSSFKISIDEGATIRQLLNKIFDIYGEEFKANVMNEAGDDLAPFYKILVDGRNAKLMSEFDTVLLDGQTVYIMPPIAGG